MATSNSFDYSVTFTDVLTESLEHIGVLHSGETLNANDVVSCRRTFNMMVKQWSGNFDFAPGLKAFQRKIGYIFLQKNQGSYSIGPSGDNASLTYVSTTMRVAAIATATTLEVTSTTGMTASDKIGIELDSGSVYWTTISSVTDGDTLVIPAPGLSGAVAIGNRIFTYTTKLMRPLYIEQLVIRDTDGNDAPLEPFLTSAYERIAVKGTDGTPSFYKYDNTTINGTLYLDVEPSDVTDVLRVTFFVPAEDYDASENDIAYPQEWFLPLALGLAKLIDPKFANTWNQNLENNFQNALAMARSSYAETTDMYFQPGLE